MIVEWRWWQVEGDEGGFPLLTRQPVPASPATSSRAPTAAVPPAPPPETKKAPPREKSIWEMTAKEQRAHLWKIHADEAGPSDRAAQRFEDYAGRHHAPGARTDSEEEETIFVVTASYRDPEVASTIARAYARAAKPERVRFGVHAQNAGSDAEPERDPVGGLGALNVSCPRHPVCRAVAEGRISVSRELWKRAEGPTVARALAERWYRNETYVAGVDSHCHFVRGWDEVAIDMFKRIGNEHAIITAYPEGYGSDLQGGDGTEAYEPPTVVRSVGCIARTRRVNVHNTVSFKHDMTKCATPNGGVRVAFFAAGFSFSRGHRVLRVPYDPHTPYVFDGEEISMGVRAWTWGYDLYQPDCNIISHLYIPSGSPLRPVFWTEDWGRRWPCQFRSLVRIHKQLRIKEKLTPGVPDDMIDLDDWDLYDVGPRRDPATFFDWARIDVVNEWGDKCMPRNAPALRGQATGNKAHCWSDDLRGDYGKPGGMPYVPWRPGTEDLFPPMVRTAAYPPPENQWWRHRR
ncbi:hypothetical protein CTAYLR_009910 [Chrysophaeum taylorii]|uniref:Uncharacterized protein n=1 Tax=Chrysophaeum taylorii TaxID=2483200 RepID=A0AAD7UAT2_9STRA|nr:hypothetical protein CTAYLR_009910 [Chrysophaeum taylorii]